MAHNHIILHDYITTRATIGPIMALDNNDKLWQIKHLADQENISKSSKYFHSIHGLNHSPEWFEPSYFLAL